MTPEQIKAVKAALTSDHHSKSEYTGRIQQTETVIVHDENGTAIQKDVSFFISWDSIDQLLSMARKRAGI
jgi:hypothetical protein